MRNILTAFLLLFSLVGYSQLFPIGPNTTGHWTKINGDSVFVPTVLRISTPNGSTTDSVLVVNNGVVKRVLRSTVGNGGGATTTNILQYLATAGDSTLVHDSIADKEILVWRDGRLLYEGVHYTWDSTTLEFTTALFANEPIKIQYGTINVSDVASATLEYLNFTTVTSGTVMSGNDWSGDDFSTSYANYGLANKSIPAGQDGYIQYQLVSGSSDNCILAFNLSNTNQRYESAGPVYNYEVGVKVLSGVIYVYDGNVDNASTGITLTGDQYIRIQRTAGVFKVFTSTDGVTFTDQYTYSAAIVTGTAATAQLYVNMNLPPFTTFSKPQIFNGQ